MINTRADELKVKSFKIGSDIEKTINDWLSKNAESTVVNIKVVNNKYTSQVLVIYQKEEEVFIRPEVSI